MRGTPNAQRGQRAADVWGSWEALKGWAREKGANERIARHSLAFAGAVSMCYLVSRIVRGLHNYFAYAY